MVRDVDRLGKIWPFTYVGAGLDVRGGGQIAYARGGWFQSPQGGGRALIVRGGKYKNLTKYSHFCEKSPIFGYKSLFLLKNRHFCQKGHF